MDETPSPGWLVGAVVAIGSAMVSAVVYLFKSLENKNTQRIEQLETQVKECESRHAECEQKHEETCDKLQEYAVQLAEVRTRLGMQSK